MNEKDFSLIVNRTKKVVLSAIREHLPLRFYHAIDDIVQETYLRGYRNLVKGGFRNESALETWLYAIARNETFRASARLLREEQKAEKAAGAEMLHFDESDLETGLLSDAAQLIEKLSAPHRDVFRLMLQGKNEREISTSLGIPPGTVKSRISRGRVELRKLREEASYGS
jgi:RNA polymerase sigma-70 factor (ECF subfamily)